MGTRSRILAVALEMFISRPYHKVSMDEIASQAQVSKGGLFHHFPNKYKLGKAAALLVVEEQWVAPMTGLFPIEDPFERLRVFIDRSIDSIIEMPNVNRLIMALIEEGVELDDGQEDWLEALSRLKAFLTSTFEMCGIPTPDMKAEVLLAALDSVGMQDFDPNAFKAELIELFVNNYKDRDMRAEG